MRILALGTALPDSSVDNYDWASAPSFFDYDALVVEPAQSVSKLVEGVVEGKGDAPLTYEDEAVLDGPTTASAVGLADLLRRRRDETERLLARGGLVVCFAYPDVPHPHVSGFTGCHRYYWLPAPKGLDYGSAYVKPASGTQVQPSDFEHPFADYLERVHSHVQYRAIFAEAFSGAHVIGRSNGGAAVAVELAVGGGRVVFLPALPPRIGPGERSNVTFNLVNAIRNALLLNAEGSPPAWLRDVSLPGLTDARQRLEAAEARLDEVEAEADEARNQSRALERYLRLLWQEGKYGLDLPVRDALALLGFASFSQPDEPAAFLYGGHHVYVETQGGSDAIGMEAHYRLRQRTESRIAAGAERPRGVIVINGWRERAPADREQQYADSLRIAAESMRYCVVTSAQLFEAVKAHLEGNGEDAAFLNRLIETEGVLRRSRPQPKRRPAAARPLASGRDCATPRRTHSVNSPGPLTS